MKFIIVSGLSGAGKSTVMSILEDSGFFCVDNMPPALIPKFAELCLAGTGAYERVAIVCDIRGGQTFDGLFTALDALREMKLDDQILFVEADTDTIIKRYKQTRRAHPLMSPGRGLAQAVELERQAMEPVRARAAYVLKTTALSVQKLRDEVLELLALDHGPWERMVVTVVSFGFKYGVPLEADMVFDARFLPNPYYVENLRDHTGLDGPVRDYIFQFPETEEFLGHLENLLAFLLPRFVEEGKSALVVAVGCTGGKHRSVAMAHALAEFIRGQGYHAGENHRDMMRA